jgi:hypothetical protein
MSENGGAPHAPQGLPADAANATHATPPNARVATAKPVRCVLPRCHSPAKPNGHDRCHVLRRIRRPTSRRGRLRKHRARHPNQTCETYSPFSPPIPLQRPGPSADTALISTTSPDQTPGVIAKTQTTRTGGLVHFARNPDARPEMGRSLGQPWPCVGILLAFSSTGRRLTAVGCEATERTTFNGPAGLLL